ncbi:AzlD domain-containing protein [Actibacterium sp. XHP0104]|uniref:AzlD domain-containing protein n=1 Tax=Actibacterium sp. XHP0104 TaxID=2984335 RepID=UPI0021E98171|nr:AzlD domain-containing protein [Actibacterium sp. XHP0104]MCV2883035.1 AzlD domain-containing protein [Actibacterium sp. XHP0104]
MTGPDTFITWVTIVALGIGTFLIRFSFLGIIGNRQLPEWVLRHLRYTAVAVLPGLIAPMVLWPAATGGQPDAARLAATAVTLGVGILSRNVLLAILSGLAALYLVLFGLG